MVLHKILYADGIYDIVFAHSCYRMREVGRLWFRCGWKLGFWTAAFYKVTLDQEIPRVRKPLFRGIDARENVFYFQ